MKFQVKIIIVTLAILIATLLLNSVLSLASFEKIYVNSLISVYEVTGMDMKRRIEVSLRYGKPLENFRGMNNLLKQVKKQNREISSVSIGSAKGEILYHLNPRKIGAEHPHEIPDFSEKKSVSMLKDDMYITYTPLYNRTGELVGVVFISFSRDVVYKRLKTMASENLKTLWVLMLFTSIGLILFLAILVVRPIRMEVLDISNILEWPGNLGITKHKKYKDAQSLAQPDPSLSDPSINEYHFNGHSPGLEERLRYFDINKIRNELDKLGQKIYTFVEYSHRILKQVDELEEEQFAVFDHIEDMNQTLSEIRKTLKIVDTEFSIREKELLNNLITQSHHLTELLDMTRHILACQNRIRRKNI